jgi:glycosyltransferase involved in cell wall biosynthesis
MTARDRAITGLARSASITLAARVTALLLGIASSVILARALGPVGRGEYALTVLIPAFLQISGGLGLEHAVVFLVARKVAMCEAMACGLPVVAARAGGIPEFVRDGADGYLVQWGNPASLQRAVLALASDRQRLRAMGQNARAYVVERCTAETMIPAELELLRAAAEHGGPSPTATLPEARARS